MLAPLLVTLCDESLLFPESICDSSTRWPGEMVRESLFNSEPKGGVDSTAATPDPVPSPMVGVGGGPSSSHDATAVVEVSMGESE